MDDKWIPQQGELQVLAGWLRDTLSGHDKSAQKQAETNLARARASPEINKYLIYLFSSSAVPQGLSCTPADYNTIRISAALALKNNIRTTFHTIKPDSLSLIRSTLPIVLQDKNPSIRNNAGSIITEMIGRGGILGWPQIIPVLISWIQNEQNNIEIEGQEGAMAALSKICEDHRRLLDKDYAGERPIGFIIPALLQFMGSDNPKIRVLALQAINVFIPHKSQALLDSFDLDKDMDLVTCLLKRTEDNSKEVRRQVCRAFVQIVEIRPEKLVPYISYLVEFMLRQQLTPDDEELACDAAEFWLTVGEHDQLWRALGPHLKSIIPVLLKSMIYSAEDLEELAGANDDADEEDRAEDIKPKFAKGKGIRTLANGEQVTEAGANGGSYSKLGDDDDLDEGEIEDFDDDDDANPEDRWNLRKCSAAALDVFATDFREHIFPFIMPFLKENLFVENGEQWPRCEAAVLALGAVAEGCLDAVVPELPRLVPFLVDKLGHPEPLVRQITCWTLGRYSGWAASLNTSALRTEYFEKMMVGLLERMADPNKRVQEAAASAFAHLEERAGATLTPYCEPIIRRFVFCFETYKDRNMFILYDCVQTLSEHVGHGLAQPELIALLMPALIDRWNKVSDQSRELFPLLECLSYVATALADSFESFAPGVFERCIKIIHQNLEEYLRAVKNPNLDTPDKDFLVTSLDLLSATIQAVDGKKAAALVSGSQPRLFELLTFCLEDPENDVRQSAYALLGDCAKYVYSELQSFLPVMLPILTQQLDLDSILDEQIDTGFSVVNNACWSSGEISIQHGENMGPFVEKLLERYLAILNNQRVPRSVLENAAIALGRLGLGNANAMAPVLRSFSGPFLKHINGVDYTSEKATAMKGFCSVVYKNPQDMMSDLPALLLAIAGYRLEEEFKTDETRELQLMFQDLLSSFKAVDPAGFNDFLDSQNFANPTAAAILRKTYNL